MPTFHGHSTSVQLSVANLKKTITQNPKPRQCPESTASQKHIDLEFAKASQNGTLAETALLGDDGRHLRFLGKLEDMPFFMVRAGKDFFDPDTNGKRTRRPARSAKAQISGNITLYDSGVDDPEVSKCIDAKRYNRPSLEPHALCLTAFLSTKSFCQTAYKNRVRTNICHDIKIDVYLNGLFFNTQFISNSQFRQGGARGTKARILRFTGLKISRFVEKPWILAPPGHDSDGVLQASRQSNPVSPQETEAEVVANQRWTTISDELLKEAERVGRNEHGERPISGEYLRSLASLPFPLEREDVQRANFGVVDVVIIWGKGQKDAATTPYLTEPTRIRLKGFSTDAGACEEAHVRSTVGGIHTPNPNAGSFTRTLKANDAHLTMSTLDPINVSIAIPAPGNYNDAEFRPMAQDSGATITAAISDSMDVIPTTTPTPYSKPAPKTRAEALATALSLDGSGDEPSKSINPVLKELYPEIYPPLRSRKQALSTSTPTQETSAALSIAGPSTRKTTHRRSREPSVSSESSNPSKRRKAMTYYSVITAKQTFAEEMQSIVEQAVEDAHTWTTRTAVMDANTGTGTVESSPLSSVPEEVSLIEIPKPSKVVTLRLSPQKLASSPHDGQPVTSPSADNTPSQEGPAPSRRQVPETSSSAVGHSLDDHFVLPALSDNCRVTFADRGVVRSVGAIRGGWFKEKGVIMGTRFIVG